VGKTSLIASSIVFTRFLAFLTIANGQADILTQPETLLDTRILSDMILTQ
jgi:hypothetical protein